MVGVRCAGCLQWGKIVLSVSRFVVLICRDVQGAFWVCLGCCFLEWYLVAAVTGEVLCLVVVLMVSSKSVSQYQKSVFNYHALKHISS